MIDVGIIIGSTRPGRRGEAVARWVHEFAQRRGDARYQLVDIATYELPLLDEPHPPSQGNYAMAHTRRWAATIAALDAFVFVTPEYNHGAPAALKNALDFLYAEWTDKAAGFVSYGGTGGTRAVEHLRGTMAELQIADVRQQVTLQLATDWKSYQTFEPAAYHEKRLATLLDEVLRWGGALAALRAP